MNAMFYRIEINGICLIILGIIGLFGTNKDYGSNRLAPENNVFRSITVLTFCICISEVISLCLHGNTRIGVYSILQICHGLFYLFSAAISYLWLMYIFVKFRKDLPKKAESVAYAIPLMLFAVVVVTNFMHNNLFSVNEYNDYARGKWVSLHWIVCGLYMILATSKTLKEIATEKNYRKRRSLYPLIYFVIPPVTMAVLQIIYKGTSILQVGFTLSILLIAVSEKDKSIYTDVLTGLGNRRGMYRYIENHPQSVPQKIYCMVIDMDNFKEINDTFGHDVGDQALVDTAQILTKVCSELTGDYYLCRYGGDEFVIAYRNYHRNQILFVKDQIMKYAEEIKDAQKREYVLGFSVGIAGKTCMCIEDVERLISAADQDMYAEKRKKHRRNG